MGGRRGQPRACGLSTDTEHTGRMGTTSFLKGRSERCYGLVVGGLYGTLAQTRKIGSIVGEAHVTFKTKTCDILVFEPHRYQVNVELDEKINLMPLT